MDLDQPVDQGAPDLRTTRGRLDDLLRRIDAAIQSGSAAVAELHARGRLTARERIDLLLDQGSFIELDALARHRSAGSGLEGRRPYGDGVVTGFGTIDGRSVCVFSQDVTVLGGNLGELHGDKIVKIMDHSLRTGCPLIGLIDSTGSRVEEGVVSLARYGEIFRRHALASGVVPQVAVIMGAAAGEQAFASALADFVIMVDQAATMFVTGPEVIEAVTGDDLTAADLGGARTHSTRTGSAHFLADDEEDALGLVRTVLSYLPQNNLEDPPVFDPAASLEVTQADRELDRLIPDAPNLPYDLREVIDRVLDDGEFLDVHKLFAPNVVVGFGRIEGRSVGVVANQPLHLDGCLDLDACEKAARLVRTCDAFNLPVITFVDVPGFLPETDQERNGLSRRGAKLIYAYAEATVPLITVITRKAYGGAYLAMGSKHLGADLNLAWPTARIAVTGAQAAVNQLYREELDAADDPDELRAGLVIDYDEELATPYLAAERGYVDAVISPHRTRAEITRSLRLLRTKREALPPKKHGNIPL
ncbi:acyl-CoA carboxylase subunit beta [Microlunatus speluncae]|uniref:acyl-CoA carboxylase subunit beta n=1 Tax=Microlunatus speluncae TaxID=2594267 RepID=UPI00126628DA|nr:acyl-CoA carboxylase subunit beta [Microlunatus speluncae]